MRSLLMLEVTGKDAFELFYFGQDGTETIRLTSVAELKKEIEPNTSVRLLFLGAKCEMRRELVDAFNGMTVKHICVVPESFESIEVYKDFLNAIAKTEVLHINAKPPGAGKLLEAGPFVACRVLIVGRDATTCSRMGLAKEDIVRWLHSSHQWEQGVREMTVHFESKQAAVVGEHVVKEFDGDTGSRSFELHIHTTSDVFKGLQHTAINNLAEDFISVSGVGQTLLVKRGKRPCQRGFNGAPTVADLVSAKTICDTLQKTVD